MQVIEINIVEETLDNIWCALANQYADSPDESIRTALNLIAALIGKVKLELNEIACREEKERAAVELKEWIEWLKEA